VQQAILDHKVLQAQQVLKAYKVQLEHLALEADLQNLRKCSYCSIYVNAFRNNKIFVVKIS
jgi:hypothetical protein